MSRFTSLFWLSALSVFALSCSGDSGQGMISCYDTGNGIQCIATSGMGPASQDVDGDGRDDSLTCADGDDDDDDDDDGYGDDGGPDDGGPDDGGPDDDPAPDAGVP